MIPGKGDGTFGTPSSFPVSARPIDIAAGYLDCPLGCSSPHRAGLDLVTANGAANTMTLLFNLGGDEGFQSPPDVATGLYPRSIAAKDFNGDGADDIAVLTTSQAGAETLSIFLNNGSGAFSSITPTNYPVDVAATALTVQDFDQDGVPDIAVLNGGDSTTGASVSVFLNQTIKTADGTIRGTGLFTVSPSFKVACPATLNGIPISCAPEDIISADFDGDGFGDLAVLSSTRGTTTAAVLAGFVNIYTGRGHGLFDFATRVMVGRGPRRIAPGDFTGDGVPDIAVTEYTSNTVRILRGIPPPLKPISGCNLDSQCESGFCVNHVCCTSRCASGEFCNISGSLGTCSPPGPQGNPCESDQQCQPGDSCVDGFCCNLNGLPACPAGEYCNTGECAGPATSGTPCSAEEQCASGHCVNDVCCDSGICPDNEFCNIPGFQGQCAPLAVAGTPCTAGINVPPVSVATASAATCNPAAWANACHARCIELQ